MSKLPVKDGEWLYPQHDGFRHVCCDCGLEHIVNFKVDVDGDVMFQWFRDEDATATTRSNSNPSYPVINWVFRNLTFNE